MSRKPLLEDVLRSVDDVDGWMSPDQAEALYDAATACAEGEQIVEIGSFRGRSTIVLASAAPQGVTVVAIDPHAGNDRGPQEIDGFGEEAQEDHTVFLANLAHGGHFEKSARPPPNTPAQLLINPVDSEARMNSSDIKP